jgi:hypothetical protein
MNMDDKVESAAKGYARLKPTRKTGEEHFYRHNQMQSLDLKLIDFWRWSASDLVSNATRGILAEYIVAHTLGLADGVRAEWDAYDLYLPTTSKPDGVKIEVKSASYLQSWFHKELSVISFNISPTQVWDAETNTLATELKRQADIYVFCLLGHKEKETLDPLNLSQWEFYVLPTTVLNEKVPTQKRIGLSSLLKLDPIKVNYEQLAECIQKMAS